MDKTIFSKASAIALNTIFGYEPKFSHNIIDALGSTEAVFSLSEEEKAGLFGPFNKYPGLINDSSLEAAAREYERLSAKGIHVAGIFDDEYPKLLRDCPDAPVAIYIKSATPPAELFNSRPAVALVGTRDVSLYGKEWCRRMVEAVSQAPARPAIVSGMAIGVDITAHVAALDAGIPTIGVLPVGIDDIYPKRHARIAEQIAASPGCALITDYPPGTAPTAVNFLRRNRIIAGMSGATILVESKIRGGGMMTARLAAGYGRDVVALPGRIDDVRSEGCNLLVREKTAEPVTSLETLPEQLGLGTYSLRKKAGLVDAIRSLFGDEMQEEELTRMISVALKIKAFRGICFDELCAATGMDYREITKYAGALESGGLISVDLMQRCGINTNFK